MLPKSSYLPHFPHHLQGSARPSAATRLARGLRKLQELGLPDIVAALGSLFSQDFFLKAPGARAVRERIYTPVTVFWAFLNQVLCPGMACQEIVGKVHAWLVTRRRNPLRPALATSAFCDARSALSPRFVTAAFDELAAALSQRAELAWLWCGRRVKVIDGTSASMPDTPANQQEWPQPSTQKPGCGFPITKMLAIFCLSTGGWLGWALSKWNRHDLGLWHQLEHLLHKGDVLLGDAGFCAWSLMAELQARGVDTVFRLHQKRSKDLRRGRSLGSGDRLQTWAKPAQRPATSPWSQEQFDALPAQIAVRVLKVRVTRKGFRTTCIWIATTLLDVKKYSAAQLAELFYRRWSIELFLRDIKTTMHMDVLRCKSPEMVRKEITFHAIAYNALRLLMLQSAARHGSELGRLSFKAALDLVRQWLPKAAGCLGHPRKLEAWQDELLLAISEVQNPHRPGRLEPRAKKRRPKNYQLLTKPRHEFREIPHREKYRAP